MFLVTQRNDFSNSSAYQPVQPNVVVVTVDIIMSRRQRMMMFMCYECVENLRPSLRGYYEKQSDKSVCRFLNVSVIPL